MSNLVEKGDLLVAPVTLQDENFIQSVILICEHDSEKGSYGIILNRPIKPSAQMVRDAPYVKNRLYKGGPVGREVMQVLHPYGESVPESYKIMEGVWIGGNPEALQKGFSDNTLDPLACRFYLGYSGWGQDQLATEFDMNSWLRVQADPDLIFFIPSEIMWSRAIRRLADQKPLFSHFPDYPSHN